MTGPLPLFPDDSTALRKPVIGAAPSQGMSLFPNAPVETPDSTLNRNNRLAVDTPPDSASRILNLQAKTGLPRAVLEANLDEIEQEVRIQGFDAATFRQQYPALASWLAENPDHAALAQDDLRQLGNVEAYLTALTRGYRRGDLMGEAATLGQQQRENFGVISAADSVRLTAVERQLARQPLGRNFIQDILYHGGEFAGQMVDMAPEIAGHAVSGFVTGAAIGAVGGPASPVTVPVAASIGATVMGAFGGAKAAFRLESGMAYLELSRIHGPNGEEIPEGIRRNASRAIGLLNASLEVASFTVILAPFVQMGQRFLRHVARDALTSPTVLRALTNMGLYYGKAIATETGTEVLQEINSAVIEDFSKHISSPNFETMDNNPAMRAQLITRLAETAAATAKGMLLIGLPGAGLTFATQVAQARRAQRRVNFFTALGEEVENSQTFQRLPEAMQEVVRRKTADSPIEAVYVDAQPITEYFQSKGLDARNVMREVLGDTKEFDDAVEHGTSIRIPMHVYATKLAPTEHNAFLANELRLGAPDVMNAREGQDAIKMAEELAKTAPEVVTDEAAFEELTQNIASQIERDGRFTGDAALKQAEQMASFFLTIEQRTGIDPQTLYDLSIGDPEVLSDLTGAETLGQTVPLTDESSSALDGPAGSTEARKAELDRRLAAWQAKNLPKQALDAGPLSDVEGRKTDPMDAIGEVSMQFQVEDIRRQILLDMNAEQRPFSQPEQVDIVRFQMFVYRLERNAPPGTEQLLETMHAIAQAMANQDRTLAALLWAEVPVASKRWVQANSDLGSIWRWLQRGDALTLYQRSQRSVPVGYRPLLDGFFSKAEALVEKEMGNKASKQQLIKLFDKIKAEERLWLGIPEFLETKDTFTKDEVMNHLFMNRVNLIEVRPPSKGQDQDMVDALQQAREDYVEHITNIEFDELRALARFDGEWFVMPPLVNAAAFSRNDFVNTDYFEMQQFATQEEVYEYVREFLDEDVIIEGFMDRAIDDIDEGEVADNMDEMVGYGGYTPADRIAPENHRYEWEKYVLPGIYANYREFIFQLPDQNPQFKPTMHFPTSPNVMGFTRVNDRQVLVNGEAKFTLFADEIQSDWHQAGRKHGYMASEVKAEYDQRAKRIDELNLRRNVILDLLGLDRNTGAELQNLAQRASIHGGFEAALEENKARLRARIKESLEYQRGFASNNPENNAIYQQRIAEAERRLADLEANRFVGDDTYLRLVSPENMVLVEEYVSNWVEAGELHDMNNSLYQLVPDAPFKKTWHELLFRNLIVKAVREGKQAIAWTTGAQQNKRWSLSQVLDNIMIRRVDADRVEVYGTKKGHQDLEFLGTQSREELRAFIGQELADKLLTDMDASPSLREKLNSITDEVRFITGLSAEDIPYGVRPDGYALPETESAAADRYMELVIEWDNLMQPPELAPEETEKYDTARHSFTEGLEVGGSGMRGFYDHMLVAYANKLGKKYGVQVVDGVISTRPELPDRLKDLEEQAEKDPYFHETVHTLVITPEMKEAVQEHGFELFQRAYHGTPYPHRIDKFKTQAILTGEGTLNQGWGLYFTKFKQAARWYRDSLSEQQKMFMYKGKELFRSVVDSENSDDSTDPFKGRSALELAVMGWDAVIRMFVEERLDAIDGLYADSDDSGFDDDGSEYDSEQENLSVLLTRIREAGFTTDKLLPDVKDWVKGWIQEERIPFKLRGDVLKEVENMELDRLETAVAPGRTYKVEIPDNDQLMDWNKTIDKQPVHVLAALSKSQILKNILENIDNPKALTPKVKRALDAMTGLDKSMAATWRKVTVKVKGKKWSLDGAFFDEIFLDDHDATPMKAIKTAMFHVSDDLQGNLFGNSKKTLKQMALALDGLLDDVLEYDNNSSDAKRARRIHREAKALLETIREEDIIWPEPPQANQAIIEGKQVYALLAAYFDDNHKDQFTERERREWAPYFVNERSGGYRLASQYLNSLGIKGHTYESGHGNQNFVIWDDKAIEIVDEFLQREQAKHAPKFRAAVRMDGKIYTGTTHEDAYENYGIETGADIFAEDFETGDVDPGEEQEGFVDQTGKWYSREEAYAAYNKAQQKSYPRGSKKLYAEDMDEADMLDDELMQDKGGDRGKITFQGEKVNIQFLEQANFSTFLHESGHLYLQILTKLVHEKGVTGQVAEDLKTIQTAIGALPGATVYTVDQHEYMADLLLAYFRKGQAPSQRLKGAFYRFRSWLKALYRSVRQLGVTLTPEVQQAFDRMFATDAEIAMKESEAEVTPLFLTAEMAGMTDEQFAAYRKKVERAHQRAVEKLQERWEYETQKQMREDYREARKELTAEVTQEVNNQQVFRALLALQLAENPDGTEIEKLKINRQDIVDLKGEEFLSELPMPFVYAREGGTSLREVTELFGYDSPDALLTDLADAPKRLQVIKEEVQKRLDARFGSMEQKPVMDEAAKAAVLNESRDIIIQAEIRALRSQQRSSARAVKQKEREVNRENKKERDYERRFLEAEKNLAVAIERGKGQAEIEALENDIKKLKNENEQALKDAQAEREYERRFLEAEAKRDQAEGAALMEQGNDAPLPSLRDLHKLARERIAMLTIRDIQPHRYWVAARRASQAAGKALGKDDYVTALNAKQTELLSVALYREAVKAKEQATRIQRYAKRLLKPSAQKRLGLAGQEYLDQINELLERFDFTPVSNKEARKRQSLLKFVEQQEELGLPVNIPDDLLNTAFKTPWKDLTVEDLNGISDVLKHIEHLSTLKNQLSAVNQKRAFDNTVRLAAARIRNKAKKLLPRTLETRLPSDTQKHLFQSFIVQHRKLSSLVREMDGFEDGGFLWEIFIRPLNAIADAKQVMTADMTKGIHEIFERYYPSQDMNGLFTKTVAPSLDNTSLTRMGRLMMALNWGAADNRAKLLSGLSNSLGREVEESEVWAVLDELTEKDWQFVEDIWQFLDTFWEPMKQLAQRLDGVAPEKIEALPFTTRFGEVRGGYFPIKYDDRQSSKAHKNVIEQYASKTMRAQATRNSTKAGSRNERVKNVKMPLRLDFGVMFEHLEEVALDLTHTEALIDLNRLLRAPEIESAIRDHYGDTKYKSMQIALRDIAAGDVPAHNAFDQSLNYLRHGSSIAALSWNVGTSILQPFGLFQGMVRVGVKPVLRGLKTWMVDAAHMENTVKWVHSVSPFMAHRATTQLREINEIQNRIGKAADRMHVFISMGIEQATLGKLDLEDVQSSFFTLITKAQLIADMPIWLGAREKAIENGADDATAIALADQAVIDSQATGQIKDLAQIQRGNPALKLWTNFYTFFSATWNLNVESVKKTNFKRPASIGQMMVDLMMINVIPTILAVELRRRLRGDEEEDEWAKNMAAEVAAFMANQLIGVRELAGIIQGFYGYGGTSGGRIFNELGKTLQQFSQGEVDAAFLRTLNTTAGIMFHYPAAQVQRTVEGFHAMMQGKAGPMALILGPPRDK